MLYGTRIAESLLHCAAKFLKQIKQNVSQHFAVRLIFKINLDNHFFERFLASSKHKNKPADR